MAKYILKLIIPCHHKNCRDRYHEKRINIKAKNRPEAMRRAEIAVDDYEENILIIDAYTVVEEKKQLIIDGIIK